MSAVVGGNEPLPEISHVSPRGNGFVEIYGNYFDTGNTEVYIDGAWASISYVGTTQVNAHQSSG